MKSFSPFYAKHIAGIFMEIRQEVVKMWHLKMGENEALPIPPEASHMVEDSHGTLQQRHHGNRDWGMS
jgi:hypothetical protein